jgi:hypothetical protein
MLDDSRLGSLISISHVHSIAIFVPSQMVERCRSQWRAGDKKRYDRTGSDIFCHLVRKEHLEDRSSLTRQHLRLFKGSCHRLSLPSWNPVIRRHFAPAADRFTHLIHDTPGIFPGQAIVAAGLHGNGSIIQERCSWGSLAAALAHFCVSWCLMAGLLELPNRQRPARPSIFPIEATRQRPRDGRRAALGLVLSIRRSDPS